MLVQIANLLGPVLQNELIAKELMNQLDNSSNTEHRFRIYEVSLGFKYCLLSSTESSIIEFQCLFPQENLEIILKPKMPQLFYLLVIRLFRFSSVVLSESPLKLSFQVAISSLKSDKTTVVGTTKTILTRAMNELEGRQNGDGREC